MFFKILKTYFNIYNIMLIKIRNTNFNKKIVKKALSFYIIVI